MGKYNNITKAQARGWSWNQLVKRIPHKLNRRKARVYVLIGDTTLDLEKAISKDFHELNVVGVDVRKEPVEAWRKAGGLAIQAPMEAVVALSKVPPKGVIMDFCSGINDTVYRTFNTALLNMPLGGCIVVNMMRGRDQIKKFRDEKLMKLAEVVSPKTAEGCKKRSYVLIMDMFQSLMMKNPNFQEKVDELHGLMDRMIENPKNLRAYRQADAYFLDELFAPFHRRINPSFHSYKSEDSNQYFDMLSVNTFSSGLSDLDKEQIEKMNPSYDWKTIKRRMAALEAVRTQKLEKMSERKRILIDERYAA